MISGFRFASPDDLKAILPLYLGALREPFFVDVSGSPPRMNFDAFREWCTDDGAKIMVFTGEGKVQAVAHFRDIQKSFRLGNFDLFFAGAVPKAGTPSATVLERGFHAACAKLGLSRVQLLALDSHSEKIELLEAFGFRREGLLRKHCLCVLDERDLIMLGWCAPDRAEALTARAGSGLPSVEPTLANPSYGAPLPHGGGVSSRRVEKSDRELLKRWYGDARIQHTIHDEKLTARGLNAKAAQLAALDPLTDGECAFIIELDQRPVAFAHLIWFDWVNRTVELDFFIAPDVRAGPFLARSVLKEIGFIVYEGFGFRKLYGFTYADNDVSVRLNTALMSTEAVLKDYLPRPGGCVDVHIHALLAEEFYARYGSGRRPPKC